MDDLISRSDAIGAVKEERFPIDSDYAEGFMAALDKVEWILKEWVPSAQPEIIWCKDCKHWFDIDDGRQKHRMCADVYGDWYCADAERRTDEGPDR